MDISTCRRETDRRPARALAAPNLALRVVRGVAVLVVAYVSLCLIVPQSQSLGALAPMAILLASIAGGYLIDAKAAPGDRPPFLLYNLMLCLAGIPLLALIRSHWRADQDFAINLGQFAALSLALMPAAYVVKLVIDGALGEAA